MTPTTKQLDLSIRWMILRDREELLRIDRASYKPALSAEELNEIILHSQCVVAVAEYEREVIGYAIYHLMDNKFILHRLAVEPVFRRLGVGTALLSQLIHKVNPQRRKSIEMILSDENLLGHLFLKALGFAAIEVLRDYEGETGHDAYLFEYSV